MANSDSDSYLQAGSLGKHISSSLFSIPGFFAGLGSKGSVDSDSLRSPTSPLDFRLFSNLSNPFGFKSISSPETESGRQNKFVSGEVGLGIINSIVVDDCETASEARDSNRRKNVIFGPQIKTKISKSSNHYIKSLGSSLKSYSLPSNYTISSLSKAKIPSSNSEAIDSVCGNGEFSALESEPFENNASFLSNAGSFSSSGIDLTQNSDPSAENFPLKSSNTIFPMINNSPQRENSLPIKSCSLPITIGPSTAYVGSLTAREIELSEDYTCIISHGPNPKTTHIFGDCILECHTDENIDSSTMEEPGIESSLAEGFGCGVVDANLRICYSCKKVLKEEHDIYLCRDGKVFCSSQCSSQEIFGEDKINKTSKDDSESSAASSYHEDLFIMGLPFAL
ncbi:FCS-Like Zinc finger 10-like [Benincasa hispida]|uniref:FCS-Like Zinc finger 10-like n=1 Tax=Benincasa hispida TaxID=102211 RepID=UPI0019000F2C|nr:FCS-Like Zinc finger 10-like [Benincasa hispida]